MRLRFGSVRVVVTVVVTIPRVTVIVGTPGIMLLAPFARVMVTVDPGSVTVEIHVTVSGRQVPPPAQTCPTPPRNTPRMSNKFKERML